jgi:hypothetical protein
MAVEIGGQRRVTLGADKGYDQKELVRGLREHRVTPHTRAKFTAPSTVALLAIRVTPSVRSSANGWKRSSAGSRRSPDCARLVIEESLAVNELTGTARANPSPEARAWYQKAVESIYESRMILSPTAPNDITDSHESIEENQKGMDSVSVSESGIVATMGQEMMGKEPKPLSASDRTRRIILENLGKIEKKTLQELVASAGIILTNSSFDMIYYETTRTIQIARAIGSREVKKLSRVFLFCGAAAPTDGESASNRSVAPREPVS